MDKNRPYINTDGDEQVPASWDTDWPSARDTGRRRLWSTAPTSLSDECTFRQLGVGAFLAQPARDDDFGQGAGVESPGAESR